MTFNEQLIKVLTEQTKTNGNIACQLTDILSIGKEAVYFPILTFYQNSTHYLKSLLNNYLQ